MSKEWQDILIAVVGAFLGSSALFTFITFMITRHDKKHDTQAALESRIDGFRNDVNARFDLIEKWQRVSEIDSCRTQLLLLISDYSGNRSKILSLAEHYFSDLKGDWYMTDIFIQWLEANDVKVPEWFKGD